MLRGCLLRLPTLISTWEARVYQSKSAALNSSWTLPLWPLYDSGSG